MDHTIALIQRSHEGDEEAKAQLVEENTGLIWCIVKRFRGRGTEAEDLFQIGSIGLLKAIDKFDLSYDVRFSTYAVPMISGEIKRFLRDDGMIKVSRSLKETAVRACACRDRLREETGREPSVEEVAALAGVEPQELMQALDAGAQVESLHRTVGQKDGREIRLLDRLEEREDREEKLLDRMLLARLLEELGAQERQLIYLRYFAERTQSEVGKMLGISQVQVSRMEKKILEKMREKI
ncbi:SigF/SigG family RNA polymerase sporulation sigma factor [Mordavella massiliensis]|uniref:RNA polymerase sigma factor n=1 Tax=Mordavella massiliensis TaxID=1871024 RepID=A0A938XBX1_9CLOT|nr:SigF/SigG family RNA polymerase sporulation sigma factor [Mordavella massiliensis]MBM6948020.1 RNA polymerase sporulation sigma factor, SigF/SigG family [Mordavella massiliensis]